jgi:ribosomal-protein-alanine N-acetyltransferase
MPARIAVRRVRRVDLDRIMEIENASFGADAYDRNLFAEFLDTGGDLFLAAEESGKLLGYLVASRKARRAEVVSVAVDPACRGRHVASTLMDSALRRLRLRGVARLVLMVKTTNHEARAFYEKYAFQKVRRVRRYYEDGADGWLMAREV